MIFGIFFCFLILSVIQWSIEITFYLKRVNIFFSMRHSKKKQKIFGKSYFHCNIYIVMCEVISTRKCKNKIIFKWLLDPSPIRVKDDVYHRVIIFFNKIALVYFLQDEEHLSTSYYSKTKSTFPKKRFNKIIVWNVRVESLSLSYLKPRDRIILTELQNFSIVGCKIIIPFLRSCDYPLLFHKYF